MSLLQTIVLLLFNDDERIPYADILRATGMEDKELKLTLQSLACGKQRVLRKEPKGRDVEDDDVFFFDGTFKAPVRALPALAPCASRSILTCGALLRRLQLYRVKYFRDP